MSQLKNSCIQWRNTVLGCRAHGKTTLCRDLLQQAAGNSEVGPWFRCSVDFFLSLNFSKAATIVKRQTFVMKTNQMMYCSFYGAREVSESQNKRGVKISTLETTNYVLGPTTATSACTYKRSGTPQPYQEYQLISCTLQIQPKHNRKTHVIRRTLMSLGYPND